MYWSIRLEARGFLQYVHVQTYGIFDAESHRRLVTEILDKPFWRPGMHAVFDHRKLDFSECDLNCMLGASKTHEASDDQIGNGRAVILVDDEVSFGRIRQFISMTDGQVSAQLELINDEALLMDTLTAA